MYCLTPPASVSWTGELYSRKLELNWNLPSPRLRIETRLEGGGEGGEGVSVRKREEGDN